MLNLRITISDLRFENLFSQFAKCPLQKIVNRKSEIVNHNVCPETMNLTLSAFQYTLALACILLLAGSALAFAQSSSAPEAAAAAPQDAKTPAKPDSPRIPRPNMADESALQQTAFSQAVADALLPRLAQGMQRHSLSQTQSVFQASRLESNFGQRIEAAFNYYDSFHLYYKTIQVSGEGADGTIVADFDLKSRPQQADLAPHRQHARLRLEVERGVAAPAHPLHVDPPGASSFFFS